MKNSVSCREAFTDELLNIAKKDRDIIAISSDARGSTALTKFTETLPNQFVEVGIAEQNEIGIAAGIASIGKKPYVCAPACFLSARSLEQIKVDVCYSNQNVKIFGVSGGVSYGALGFSHHSLHDIAVLRTFPNIRIILPCDGNQTIAMLNKIKDDNMPTYIRVGRNKVPQIYDSNDSFSINKANILKQGNDVAIIACGEMVYYALLAAKELEKDNIYAMVIDMHTLKPLDEEALHKAIKETKVIITVEEHSLSGGLGAAVSQYVSKTKPMFVSNLGFPDEFLKTGESKEIFSYYKLDDKSIYNEAKNILSKFKSF